MQNLDEPSGMSVGIPKIGIGHIPFKGILIVFGMLIFSLVAVWFIVRSNVQQYDDSAVWNAINSMNSSITNRQYIDSNFNSLGSRLDQVTAQLTGMKTDITSIKNDVKNLKLNSTNSTDYSARLTKIENRLGNVESNLSKLGNLSWIAGFPIANSSTPVKYLCDVTGVPDELKFQYTFSCMCDMRKTYGPYLNLGGACMVNRDQKACSCYYTICDSKEGMC
jgi:hypothetical protein